MYWFILIFPLLIYPWGPVYYTLPKVFYLDLFVLSTWIILFLKREYWIKNIQKYFTLIELVVLIFICLIGISTLNSVNVTTSIFGTTIRYEGLITFISYCSIFVFSYRLMSRKEIRKVIPGIVIVSIFVSLYGILQHYSVDFLPRRKSLSFDSNRSYSFFDNPNFFGSYTVLVLILAITLFLCSKNKKFSFLLYTSTCISYTAMLFTSTRSAWVGLFIGILMLIIFVVWNRRDLWKRWLMLLVTFCMIFIFINATEKGGTLNRLITTLYEPYKVVTLQGNGMEGSYRIFIWKKSLPLLGKYYLTGSGPDTFEYVFPNNDKEKKKLFGKLIFDKAHNEYLQMAITLGIPTLLTYLFLVSMVLIRAFQAAKRVEGNEKVLIYGLISTIFGYLGQAFFNISVVPVAPIYWSLLGITLATSNYYLKYTNVQKPIMEHHKNIDESA